MHRLARPTRRLIPRNLARHRRLDQPRRHRIHPHILPRVRTRRTLRHRRHCALRGRNRLVILHPVQRDRGRTQRNRPPLPPHHLLTRSAQYMKRRTRIRIQRTSPLGIRRTMRRLEDDRPDTVCHPRHPVNLLRKELVHRLRVIHSIDHGRLYPMVPLARGERRRQLTAEVRKLVGRPTYEVDHRTLVVRKEPGGEGVAWRASEACSASESVWACEERRAKSEERRAHVGRGQYPPMLPGPAPNTTNTLDGSDAARMRLTPFIVVVVVVVNGFHPSFFGQLAVDPAAGLHSSPSLLHHRHDVHWIHTYKHTRSVSHRIHGDCVRLRLCESEDRSA